MSIELSQSENDFLVQEIYPNLAEHARNLDRIVSSWRDFIANVEQGYSFSSEDFSNDLERFALALIG